eukprot:CAMPEP_0185748446 /NCGR_PEP_ID=MMETSP1174-20130828/7133_1 /TAXON_ID=35687 /ORGANISM="Dictyocha speculum, Strain CCMP1381" /LENGTH=176 /DNA_ID=CAMNT_0028424123 /DNA_START=23 /DNA_END=554 /DNA_ORIENTATION=+
MATSIFTEDNGKKLNGVIVKDLSQVEVLNAHRVGETTEDDSRVFTAISMELEDASFYSAAGADLREALDLAADDLSLPHLKTGEYDRTVTLWLSGKIAMPVNATGAIGRGDIIEVYLHTRFAPLCESARLLRKYEPPAPTGANNTGLAKNIAAAASRVAVSESGGDNDVEEDEWSD